MLSGVITYIKSALALAASGDIITVGGATPKLAPEMTISDPPLVGSTVGYTLDTTGASYEYLAAQGAPGEGMQDDRPFNITTTSRSAPSPGVVSHVMVS
jgi:hypothetical protein